MIDLSFADFNWLLAAALFGSYVVVDALYALYTLWVVDRRPIASANVSLVMHFLLAAGVISYVHNFAYVIPITADSWVGAYLVVRLTRRLSLRQSLGMAGSLGIR